MLTLVELRGSASLGHSPTHPVGHHEVNAETMSVLQHKIPERLLVLRPEHVAVAALSSLPCRPAGKGRKHYTKATPLNDWQDTFSSNSQHPNGITIVGIQW